MACDLTATPFSPDGPRTPTSAKADSAAWPSVSKQVWAWAFYDFANSPFATTILSVIFNVYFAGVVAAGAPVPGISLWSFLVAGSTVLSGLISPYLGALADIRRCRKRWLTAAAIIGSMATAGLAFSKPGTWISSSILFVIAGVCFTLSLTFYHSFLNDLSTGTNIGRISGFGWAVGYIGGGSCLALNLWMIQDPGAFLLPVENYWPVRATFLVVGAWWLIFTVPFLVWIQEPPAADAKTSGWRTAWRRLRESFKNDKNTLRFLFAYLLYNDVIETVIVMAALFASQELSMSQKDIISCFLMIQFVAFVGALACGRLADRMSNKKVLQAVLVLWTAILAWTLALQTQTEFWVAAVLIALIMGGSQSVSRSLFGKMVPADEKAQFYGFYGLSGKISAAAGPLLFGAVHQITGDLRWSIASLIPIIILGQILLAFVREPVLSNCETLK